ncbi:MAG: hypothetical protein J0H40_17950 [Rhizobiales bacterium]|nr:hypothetical protein [Hyphomicrobiales bacterium]
MSACLRLVTSPTVDRAETVKTMASDLLRFDSFRTESDAIRSLFGHYPMFAIAALVDDARQVAMQETVAMEMSR